MTLAPLTGKQSTSLHLADGRLNIWEGSVRSSKTVVSVQAWLRFLRTGPAGDVLLVGRTERTVRRNIINPLVDMLGANRCRYIAGTGELWVLGRRVYVAGANDESSQERIRGLTLAAAYVDEASTVPESFWVMLVSRLSIAGARLFATTNPEGPAHWLKQGWLDRACLHLPGSGRAVRVVCAECGRPRCLPGECAADDRLDLHRFSFRIADNPHLPDDYVRSIAREYTGLWHRRFILGEWVQAEGAIYTGWDDPRHVVDELPELARWVGVGVDYGTLNAFSAVAVAVTADERLAVVSEWRHDGRRSHRQLTDAEYSQELQGWLAGLQQTLPGRSRTIAVDPSAASFQTQLFRAGVRGVTDADNRVADGIRTVASLIAADRLIVHRSCRGLIDEIPGYVWDDKAAAKGEDRPLKTNDHSLDALRYAVMTGEPWWRRMVPLTRWTPAD